MRSSMFNNRTARHRTVLRVEALEDRLTPSTDIQVNAFLGAAAGRARVNVVYSIVGDPSPAFKMDFYRSTNAQWDASDALLGSIPIQAAGELAAGVHVKNLALGTAAGQLRLPGAGVADVAADYYLLAVADSKDLVVETDLNPQAEDNTAVFTGVYHLPGGPVMVQTGEGADVITAKAAATTTSLTINGAGYTHANADFTQYVMRLHGGDDRVQGNILKPQQVWAGDGNDVLVTGAANDVLRGGAGNDWLSAGAGNDSLYGEAGVDTLVTGLGKDTLRPGAEIDQIIWTKLIATARAIPVKVGFSAFIPGAGVIAGEGAGSLLVSVSANGALSAAGVFSATFNATGNGSGGGGGCTATYAGTASGAVKGPLASAAIIGTAKGNYFVHCPDGNESGTETAPFRGTAVMPSDLIYVQINGSDFHGSGSGEYTVITTSTIG